LVFLGGKGGRERGSEMGGKERGSAVFCFFDIVVVVVVVVVG
jgi:hypothetical protein